MLLGRGAMGGEDQCVLKCLVLKDSVPMVGMSVHAHTHTLVTPGRQDGHCTFDYFSVYFEPIQ